MVNKAQGFGLSLITKMASSDVLDQLKLRKFIEKSLYQGSKAGYKTLSKTQKAFKANKDLHKQRLNNQEKSLFDLNYSANDHRHHVTVCRRYTLPISRKCRSK